MTLLPDLFNSRKVKALAVELHNTQSKLQQLNIAAVGNNIFQNNLPLFPSWDTLKNSERYSSTDDIYSIITLLSKTAALIPLYVYEVKDDLMLKSINKRNKSHENNRFITTKALVDVSSDDHLYKLLEDPHLYLSKYEFLEAIYIQLALQGECIIYKLRAESGVNAGLPVKLEFLESKNVIRHYSGFPHCITRYEYREKGIVIIDNIPPEDVIHIRYYKTLSPLQALWRRLTRIDSEMDVSVSQLQNGGTPGIVYHKDGDYAPQVVGQYKENFFNYLQNKENKGAPFWAGSGELGYLPMGLPLTDLGVLELAKIDFKKLCNAFGVSDVLFNNDAASTESNVLIQQKRLYTNTVLPNVYRVRDSLNLGLVNEYQNVSKGIRHIECDLTDITELHEDMAKKVAQFSAMPVMIPNQIFEAMGFPKIDNDPMMDRVYVKTGYTALEDLQGSQDLPMIPDYSQPIQ